MSAVKLPLAIPCLVRLRYMKLIGSPLSRANEIPNYNLNNDSSECARPPAVRTTIDVVLTLWRY